MGSIIQNAANNIGANGVFSSSALNNTSLSGISALPSGAGGKLKLLSTQTASNSTTTSFTSGIDSTYPIYIIDLINIHNDTSDVYLQFNFSTDGGSTYNVTKTTTAFNAYHTETDAAAALSYEASVDLAQGTGSQRLTAGQHNVSDTGHSGRIIIFNPSSNTFVKHFMSDISTTGYDGANEYNYHMFIAGYGNTTSPINAIQFSMNSGTHDGTFKLYGISA